VLLSEMRLIPLAVACSAAALCTVTSEWNEPFPPHKVAGNVYYVGSNELAVFLITTPAGHILINTGYEETVPLIQAGCAKLGFRFEDVRILLRDRRTKTMWPVSHARGDSPGRR
jgi:metallo-beta-lactamase class B